MEKIVLTSVICFNILFCFSQTFPKKQTLIPLSNVNGVPFYKDEELDDLAVDGFEVDDKGNFYFMGGEKSVCLAVFSGNMQIYRKTYKEFPANQIYLYHSSLFTFNNNGYNDIFIINPTNGVIIKRYNKIASKRFNSYKFVDSSLVATITGINQDTYEVQETYEQYTLHGKYVKQVPTSCNIPLSVVHNEDQYSHRIFIGKWNNNYVFLDITGDSLNTKTIWLVSNEGKILATKNLPNSTAILGKDYYESFPTENKKVRNGNLYILGHKGKYALITEIPLQTFFYK